MDWNILIQLEKRKQHRREVRYAVKRWLSAASVILVLYLGFAESVAQSGFWRQVDKGMHFLLFGLFSFLFIQFAQQNMLLRSTPFVRWTVMTILLSMVCSVGEWIHLFVPSRTFEWGDMVANFSGTAFFGLLAVFLFPSRKMSDSHRIIPFEEQMNVLQGNDAIKVRRPRRNSRETSG